MNDIDKINELALNEYFLFMEAHELKTIDKEYYLMRQAWENMRANATEKKGNKIVSSYDKFSKFYNYDKALNMKKDKKAVFEQLKKRAEGGGTMNE